MSNNDNDKRWGDFIPTKSKKWNVFYPKEENTPDTVKIVDGFLSNEEANEVKNKVANTNPKYSLEEKRLSLYSPLKIRDNPNTIDNSLISLIHDLVTKDFIRIIGVTPNLSVEFTSTEITFGRKDRSYNIRMIIDPFNIINLAGHYPDYLEFNGDILLEWIYNNIELHETRENSNEVMTVTNVDKLGKFLLDNKYVFFYSSSSSIQDMRFAGELQEEFFQEEKEKVVEKKLNPIPQKIEIETELKEEIEIEIEEDDPIKKKEDIIDKLRKAAEEVSLHIDLWRCRNYMLFPILCSTGSCCDCPFYAVRY